MGTLTLLEEIYLQEGGFSRTAQILAGQTPKVKSYALMTAENPYGEEHGTLENSDFNDKLEQQLKTSGLGYIKVKGKFFGNVEHSYLIPNISQAAAVNLGKKYGQFSIIYGDKNPQTGGMVHKYIEGGEVVQTRKTFNQLARDAEDMFSTIKGRKFKVPFFDPEKKDKEFKGGTVSQGAPDVDQTVSPEKQTERDTERDKHIKGFTPLLNKNGRKVWVYKHNAPKYLKLGYKKETPNERQ